LKLHQCDSSLMSGSDQCRQNAVMWKGDPSSASRRIRDENREAWLNRGVGDLLSKSPTPLLVPKKTCHSGRQRGISIGMALPDESTRCWFSK